MFTSCCTRPDKFSHDELHNGSEKMLMDDPGSRPESNMSCGIGIAFKPDSKGALAVRRLISGGSAESSGAVQVNYPVIREKSCR
jgi:hypothetical protein